MLDALNFVNVKNKIKILTFIFIFKIIHGEPNYLSNLITYNYEVHSYNTRTKNNIHAYKKTNLNITSNSLLIKGCRDYNTLPDYVIIGKCKKN